MRKKEKQWITIGLIAIFGVVAWWAYSNYDLGGFIDLSDWLNKNSTSDTNTTETYSLAVADLAAIVDQASGHVTVSFSIANEEHFNISSVKVLYALNVADPTNASYTEISTTKTNSTYEAEIPSAFGDVVYYKVRITYDTDKVLESNVQSITVTDTLTPTINNITVSYNATTGNATFTINASDNDALDKIVFYYAITTDGNATTFQNVTLSTSPYETTLTLNANDYVDFYAEAYDLSGNSVRLPANGTFEFYANETKVVTYPQSG